MVYIAANFVKAISRRTLTAILGAFFLFPATEGVQRVAYSYDAILNVNDPVDVVARTLWGEARGEGRAGMEIVGSVIMNRLHSGKWIDIIDVCLANRQFSCWNPNDKNYYTTTHASTRDLTMAMLVAREEIAGLIHDTTGGAEYFLSAGTKRAVWLRNARFMGRKHGFDLYRG